MEIEEEIKSIKEIVKDLLETDNQCRNSDKFLIVQTLRKLGFKIFIEYGELERMPSWETIRRTRQKLQEENQNLRADEHIQELRNEMQDKFKEYFKPTRGIETSNFIPNQPKGIEIFER